MDSEMQPINLLTNTRLVLTQLDKTFYKELSPFAKDEVLWSAFAWRISKQLDVKTV